ncbi:MAG: alternative ribosome rescue aminoacyl-tRNA hydrolase ArfB [Wenzhouxiangellaceae bacterium]
MPRDIDQRNLPPEDELEERFVLAGGPGGQHVNRTESAVQLRWNVAGSAFLPEEVKRRLLRLAGRRADSSGTITIEARSHRSQWRNREEARKRLADLISRARKRPRKRIATQPTRASRLRRLAQKRRRTETKRARRRPAIED